MIRPFTLLIFIFGKARCFDDPITNNDNVHADDWHDPFNMFSDAVQNSKEIDLVTLEREIDKCKKYLASSSDKYSSITNVESTLLKHVVRDWLGKLNINDASSDVPGRGTQFQGSLNFGPDDLATLIRFLDASATDPGYMDKALRSQVILMTMFEDVVVFRESDSESNSWRTILANWLPTILLCANVLILFPCAMMLVRRLIHATWKQTIAFGLAAVFVLSVASNWYDMYLVKQAERNVRLSNIPLHCKPATRGMAASIWSQINSLFSWSSYGAASDCVQFEKDLMSSPQWETSIMDAVTVTITKVIVKPLGPLGAALQEFSRGLFQGVPLQFTPVIIVVVIIVLVFATGYSIHLPLFLGSLRAPAPVSNDNRHHRGWLEWLYGSDHHQPHQAIDQNQGAGDNQTCGVMHRSVTAPGCQKCALLGAGDNNMVILTPRQTELVLRPLSIKPENTTAITNNTATSVNGDGDGNMILNREPQTRWYDANGSSVRKRRMDKKRSISMRNLHNVDEYD